MALETVDVVVQSNDVVPVLLDGVVVRVYDATGATLITEATTGVGAPSGHVQFLLNGTDPATNYTLRFFKSGASFVQPKTIDIYSPASSAPTGTNNFKVTATLLTQPVAVNPRMCRVSGYIQNPVGQAWRGITIQFIRVFEPLVVDQTTGVIGERVAVHTDSSGYIEVDLFRGCTYDVLIAGHENVLRTVHVPDRSSVNLMSLLFPTVVAVSYDPAPPWSITVGTTLTVAPSLQASNFQILEGTATDDVRYVPGNDAVVSLRTDGTLLYITGVAAGTTTVSVERLDRSIIYLPDPGISGSPASITVV